MTTSCWRIILPLVLAVCVLPGGACGPGSRDADEVVVFAAASLRDAMEELGSQFEEETKIKVLFNIAGSNVLAQQIVATPRADLFLSASQRWMDTVEEAGRLVAGTRRSVLSNRLVVIAHPQSAVTLNDPCALGALDFKYLALGDPDAVPAGQYARTWLASRTCGGQSLWQALEGRIAPTPDVRAALSLVLADPGLVGIVYKTDWLVFAGQARLLYEVPVEEGPAIRYVLAQIAESPNPDGARRFLDYLTKAPAREVFERHGFTPLAAD